MVSMTSRGRSWGGSGSFGFTCHVWECNGWQHKLYNQHMHFHPLVNTLAVLNENQRLSVHFQEPLYLIWFWRLPQQRKSLGKSTKPQQNDPLTDTQPAEKAHRSLQLCYGSGISKVVTRLKSAWFPYTSILTLRTGWATKSDYWFLRRHRRFATVVRPNSITLSYCRPMVALNQHFMSSNVNNLPLTRHCCYISM